MEDFLYSDLSGAILAAYRAVYTTLGPRRHSFTERALVAALAQELRARGHQVRTQVELRHRYQQRRPDQHSTVHLVVDGKIALLVKRVQHATERHQQLLRGQIRAGGWAVGLVLNFGGAPDDYHRVYEPLHDPTRREAPHAPDPTR